MVTISRRGGQACVGAAGTRRRRGEVHVHRSRCHRVRLGFQADGAGAGNRLFLSGVRASMVAPLTSAAGGQGIHRAPCAARAADDGGVHHSAVDVRRRPLRPARSRRAAFSPDEEAPPRWPLPRLRVRRSRHAGAVPRVWQQVRGRAGRIPTMPKHRPSKIARPDSALLARSIEDLLAEHDQAMDQVTKLLARAREISAALDWMKCKEFRHKWTAPKTPATGRKR